MSTSAQTPLPASTNATAADSARRVLRVTDLQTRESVEVPAGATLLAAIEYSGKQMVPVGCRNGGCGACRVRVLSGTFVTGAMSRRYVSAEELAQGFALACKITPGSDLEFICAPMAPRPARNIEGASC